MSRIAALSWLSCILLLRLGLDVEAHNPLGVSGHRFAAVPQEGALPVAKGGEDVKWQRLSDTRLLKWSDLGLPQPQDVAQVRQRSTSPQGASSAFVIWTDLPPRGVADQIMLPRTTIFLFVQEGISSLTSS